MNNNKIKYKSLLNTIKLALSIVKNYKRIALDAEVKWLYPKVIDSNKKKYYKGYHKSNNKQS